MAQKHTLSPEQDIAANPLENVWVQANAGTGKTSVLVQRLLRILFRTPDSASSGILCLTYTNAGAGEMRNRILAALRKWAMATDAELADMLDGVAIKTPVTTTDIARAREIFFKFIDKPEMMKIKTIHGFCEEILHRFPIEAGLSPAWSLISDSPQRILLQETFERLINSSAHSPRVYSAFEYIVTRISETYMTDLLEILSSNYKYFFQINDIDNYRKYFIDTTADFLNINNDENLDFDPNKLQNIIEIATRERNNAKKPAKYLDEIITNTRQYIDTTLDFDLYKKIYLKDDGEKRLTISKRDFLADEQDRVYRLNQSIANRQVFDDTVALFDLSSAFALLYREIKRSRNVLDFEDLILYTRKLFSSPDNMGWVLSQLDVSLSHILLDEAQDTSPAQWDILRMLSGDFFSDGDTTDMPHSLFVVGDTKQSIYGFQGADPHAFAASRTEIGAQIQNNLRTIREVPLAQSFRSASPILHAVDKFFSDPEIIAQTGFTNNPHKCFRQNARGTVEIHKLISKADSGATIRDYARKIAGCAQELITSGRFAARDIMVLVQSRTSIVTELSQELKRRSLDVAGSDRIVLPNFPAIRDMLNLVRFCLNPCDDYSLCCVLKSPLFGLKEHDIFNVCTTKNNTNSARLRENPDAQKVTVFEVLAGCFPNIHTRLSQYLDWGKNMPPYTFFSNVLNADDIRAKIIAALGVQVIDPLEEFMTICLSYERTQSGMLHQFLKWFITGGSEIKRDMDASNGIRIVTVHGSKGLEAPVVFLIDTVRTPKADSILPIPSDGAPVWIWAPRKDQSARRAVAAELSMIQKISEYYRLLYVAMTRARDELYIYGYTTNKSAPDISWHNQLWRVFADGASQEYIRITNDDIA